MVHHWPWLIIWKWHFWEKIVLKRELLHFLSTFISGNKYHRWAQQSFLELTVLLSNSSGEKNINSTERLAQGASAVCNKDFKLQISAQHSWSVPNLLRGRPTDLSSSFLHSQCPKQWYSSTGLTTLKSLKQLPDIVWIFVQISHFQVIFDGQWWNQISTHFSDSRHQECMIFARIGDGPCNCYSRVQKSIEKLVCM